MRRLVKGFEADSASDLADQIDRVSDRWDKLVDIKYNVVVVNNNERILHSAIVIFEDEEE